MANLRTEKVLSVHHWTPQLFSFRTTRDRGFRYESGMFTMLGLTVAGKPLLRAYSIVSPSYAEELEFLSIIVPNGPLTSQLRHLTVGDEVLVSAKATGTLVQHSLKPGRVLYLLATGTGIAAFMGIVQEPDVYERFERIVLVHSVRHSAELAYREFLENGLLQHEYVGEAAASKFIYCPIVTREPFPRQKRITDLIRSGGLFEEFSLDALNPEHDRLMLCGNAPMLGEMSHMLTSLGFTEGSNAKPGDYVVEKAFVDQLRGPKTVAAE